MLPIAAPAVLPQNGPFKRGSGCGPSSNPLPAVPAAAPHLPVRAAGAGDGRRGGDAGMPGGMQGCWNARLAGGCRDAQGDAGMPGGMQECWNARLPGGCRDAQWDAEIPGAAVWTVAAGMERIAQRLL